MIIKTWNWISNVGVSENHPEENELIRLYNMTSLLCSIGVLLVILWAWFLDFSTLYIFITSFILLVYIFIVPLNFFGKINIARYVISLGTPIWATFIYFLIGGYFCQGVTIIAAMAITYVAFQKRPKIILTLFIFQIVLFFSLSTYVNIYGPLLGVIDFPYDEIIVFIGSLGWIIIVFYKFNKDRTSLLLDLKANNEELKNTTEELERFTYIASHDLKSPLRTIISFIGLIERDVKREKYSSIQENLQYVKTGAEQMNYLVKDILELSKLREEVKAERSLIDLNLVFEKAKHNLKEEIGEKNATIYCEGLSHFYGNELEFLLIFQNFIQNGIKYNESKNPTITVSSLETSNTLNLHFKDNGIGIDEQYHDQIFQFFKRLHNSEKYQGTGLGLGLCKKIINNYNGEIEVNSQLGYGTTFTIKLPITQSIEIKANALEAISSL